MVRRRPEVTARHISAAFWFVLDLDSAGKGKSLLL
jgi:hypothetical protein